MKRWTLWKKPKNPITQSKKKAFTDNIYWKCMCVRFFSLSSSKQSNTLCADEFRFWFLWIPKILCNWQEKLFFKEKKNSWSDLENELSTCILLVNVITVFFSSSSSNEQIKSNQRLLFKWDYLSERRSLLRIRRKASKVIIYVESDIWWTSLYCFRS